MSTINNSKHKAIIKKLMVLIFKLLIKWDKDRAIGFI